MSPKYEIDTELDHTACVHLHTLGHIHLVQPGEVILISLPVGTLDEDYHAYWREIAQDMPDGVRIVVVEGDAVVVPPRDAVLGETVAS